jgi:mannuronan 5-epimerase
MRSLLLILVLGFSGWAGAQSVVNYQLQIATPVSANLEPKLPDLSGYTESAIRLQLAQWHDKPGQISEERLIGKVETRKFFSSGRIIEWSRRQGQFPRIIMLRNGLVTLPQLAKALPGSVVKLGPHRYLARLPMAIGLHAALLVEQGESLLLSEDRGSFLINAGHFYLLHGELLGWREQSHGPALYTGDKNHIRPFYTAWSDSRTYMYGSTIAHLGASSSKAYGVTLSSYTEADELFAPLGVPRDKHPQGWFIGNRFEDLFYGFYCYEANDVVIIRNEYANNIYYGIDPHDRSKRLIIAENQVWGSKTRHGIIISREVDDSFIFRNVVHDNRKSGIMLDRLSNHNVVAQNVSYNNGGDGIVLYESHDNLLWANQVYQNQHHGIRFRNSRDVRMLDNMVVDNGRYGIYGHLRDLRDDGRDTKLDPYEQRASAVIQGGLISKNQSGAIFVDQPEYFRMQDLVFQEPDLRASKPSLNGALAQYQPQILRALRQHGVQVSLQSAAVAQGGH